MVIGLIALMASFIHFYYAQEAQGLLGIGSLCLLPVLLGTCWIFFCWLRDLLRYIKKIKNKPAFKSHIVPSLLILTANLVLVIAGNRANHLIEGSKKNGNLVIDQVAQYKVKFGSYPKDLDQLKKAGFVVKSPELKNSIFHYGLTEKGPMLSFDSLASSLCSRSISSPAWTCGD